MTFKEKLVILRKAKGLTQDEFAAAVGVSRQAVYKWECGQSYPEVPKLLEMKLLFSISIDELLDDSFDIPIPEKKKRKRVPKETAEKIEKEVKSTVSAPKAAPAPKPATPVFAYTAPVATPIVEEKPAEKVPEKEKTVFIPTPTQIQEEEAANVAPVVEEEKEENKKSGLFGRLFGRK